MSIPYLNKTEAYDKKIARLRGDALVEMGDKASRIAPHHFVSV